MRDLRGFYSATLENERNMSFKLSDAEDLKHHFGEFCRQKKEAKFSLLITGKTGVGKSSLVNALVGTKVAKEGHKKVVGTFEVTSYRATIEGVDVRVWDSPGLRDGTGNDKNYLAEIASKITEKLDLVIICLRMDDARLSDDDRRTLQILTETFGKNLWKNAVIALTFANKVEHPAREDREGYFLEQLENWREVIHEFLGNDLKLDPELVQSLPLVPTGYHRKPCVLPSGENWLSKFWVACYNVGRKSTAFSLYRINIARVRFPGSEEVAAICGGSEGASTTPGLDDSEISPIDLDKEQQESFWNTTWEAFKEHCLRTGIVLGAICTMGAGILRVLVR